MVVFHVYYYMTKWCTIIILSVGYLGMVKFSIQIDNPNNVWIMVGG